MISFWVTNYSKQNVTLSDLNITIRYYSSVNLLDQRHYKFTEEQLIKSRDSGSLFNKRHKISIRSITPIGKEDKILFDTKSFLKDNRARSYIQVKETYFPELDVSDERLAEEKLASDNADIEINKNS